MADTSVRRFMMIFLCLLLATRVVAPRQERLASSSALDFKSVLNPFYTPSSTFVHESSEHWPVSFLLHLYPRDEVYFKGRAYDQTANRNLRLHVNNYHDGTKPGKDKMLTVQRMEVGGVAARRQEQDAEVATAHKLAFKGAGTYVEINKNDNTRLPLAFASDSSHKLSVSKRDVQLALLDNHSKYGSDYTSSHQVTLAATATPVSLLSDAKPDATTAYTLRAENASSTVVGQPEAPSVGSPSQFALLTKVLLEPTAPTPSWAETSSSLLSLSSSSSPPPSPSTTPAKTGAPMMSVDSGAEYRNETYLRLSQEQIDEAINAALIKRLGRRLYRIRNLTCVSEGALCILQFFMPVAKPKGQQQVLLNLTVFEDDDHNCSDEAHPMDVQCCRELTLKINQFISSSNGTINQLLSEARCRRLYCESDTCEFLGCAAPRQAGNRCELPANTSYNVNVPSTTTPSLPVTGITVTTARPPRSAIPTSTRAHTSHDQASLKNADDDDTGANSTVIIVSSLLTFLAGIVGAVLITWLWRRRRNSKGKSRDNSSTGTVTYMVSKTDSDAYEEPPMLRTPDQKGGGGGIRGGRPNAAAEAAAKPASENEYSYIPEQVPAAAKTSGPYNLPGDHLADRPLPLPSAPPAVALRPLPVAGRSANGDLGRGAYSLARSPAGGDPTGPDAAASADGYECPRPNSNSYFVLDIENALLDGGGAYSRQASGFKEQFQEKEHPRPLTTSDLFHSKQRHVTPPPKGSAGSGNGARRAPISGKGEYFTPLDRGSQEQDPGYSVLGDLHVGDSSTSVGPPDYLELLPDDPAQTPVK